MIPDRAGGTAGDLDERDWAVLEHLAREAGRLLRTEHIPQALVDRGLVVADGCCWKLSKAGWCLVMLAASRDRSFPGVAS